MSFPGGYWDGWLGGYGVSGTPASYDSNGIPDPLKPGGVRISTESPGATPMVERLAQSPPTDPDPGTGTPPAPQVLKVELNAPDYRHLYLQLDQHCQLGSGVFQVKRDGVLLPLIAGADLPLPWVLRIRLVEPANEIGPYVGGGSPAGSTDDASPEVYQVAWGAGSLVSQLGVPIALGVSSSVDRVPTYTIQPVPWVSDPSVLPPGFSLTGTATDPAPLWALGNHLARVYQAAGPIRSLEGRVLLSGSLAVNFPGLATSESTTSQADGSTFTCQVAAGGGRTLRVPCKAQGAVPILGGLDVVGWDGTNLIVKSSEACAASGSGGVNLYVGTVLGGNVDPINPTRYTADDPNDPTIKKGMIKYTLNTTVPTDAQLATSKDEAGYLDTDYPTSRPYGFPQPLLDGQGAYRDVPFIQRWDRFDLPANWKFGDKLPRLPDGLCYVRLSRPYVFGAYSWNGNLDLPPATSSPYIQFPRRAIASLASGATTTTTITLYWQLKGWTVPRQPNSQQPIDLTTLIGMTGPSKAPDGTANKIKSVTYQASAGTMLLTLVGPLSITDATQTTLTIREGALESAVQDTTVNPPVTTTYVAQGLGSLQVEFLNDRSTVIICHNGTYSQGWGPGDGVVLADRGTIITDHHGDLPGKSNIAYQLLDILGGLGAPLPQHTHQTAGGGLGGGGRLTGAWGFG